MSKISIYLSEDDEELVRRYCEKHNLTMSAAFRDALIEKIEDEIDIILGEEALKHLRENPKTYSLEEVEKMFDLN